MARILISNGYVVTVNSSRNVFPGGYVAIDGATIALLGASNAVAAFRSIR